jgi:NADH-quinone oxidoreductase subunit A
MTSISAYAPILILLTIGLFIPLVALTLGHLLGKKQPSSAKQAAYECGFPPFEDARMPFDVRYYLVAILFIIFDLETAFLFPWAVAFRHIGWFGVCSMGLFLFVLIIGFIYEWRKGALSW